MDKTTVYLEAQGLLGAVLVVLASGIRTVEIMMWLTSALVLCAELAMLLRVL